jgi:hypothetical protein
MKEYTKRDAYNWPSNISDKMYCVIVDMDVALENGFDEEMIAGWCDFHFGDLAWGVVSGIKFRTDCMNFATKIMSVYYFDRECFAKIFKLNIVDDI